MEISTRSQVCPTPPSPARNPALTMNVGQFVATEKALRIPELLTSVLRCLGPLEWIKCASVCSDWRDIILGGGDQAKHQRPVVAAAAKPVALASPVTPRSTTTAASTTGGGGETTTRSEEGKAEGKAEVVVAAPVAAVVDTADLWCEFAVTAMRYRDPCATAHIGDSKSEDNNSINSRSAFCSGRTHRGHHHHATVLSRCRERAPLCLHSTSAPGHFYRTVCLEGDPIVLGPPLRATAARIGNKTAGRGEATIATVSLTDVAAAPAARCRHTRYGIVLYAPSGSRHGCDSSDRMHSTEYRYRMTAMQASLKYSS